MPLLRYTTDAATGGIGDNRKMVLKRADDALQEAKDGGTESGVVRPPEQPLWPPDSI